MVQWYNFGQFLNSKSHFTSWRDFTFGNFLPTFFPSEKLRWNFSGELLEKISLTVEGTWPWMLEG